MDFLNLGDVPKDKMQEATYFACMKILSESIGKLPLHLLKSNGESGVIKATDHPLYRILKYRPNRYMTSTAFWTAMENNRNHYGNAYAMIGGYDQHTELWVLPPEEVEIWYDDQKILADTPDIWYLWNHGGNCFKFSSSEVIHLRTSTSFDGITGLSVRDILRTTLEGSQKAQQMLNRLYDNGFAGKMVFQYTGELNTENEKILMRKIQAYAKGEVDGINNLLPVPTGFSLQPLDIKLTDAQFLDVKKYSALQIAAAFGIKPNQINDYEKSSYASAEAQQLAFYVDTLLYVLKQIEEELTYKLLTPKEISQGYHFKFNVSVILRADLKTQIDTLSTAVGNFIYTPNEARAFLDLAAKEHGDQLIGNGSTIPIQDIGSQYRNTRTDDLPTDGLDVADEADRPQIAQVSLNGAQISSILEVVQSVARHEMELQSAITLLTTAFPFDHDTAVQIIGNPELLNVPEKGGEAE